MRFYKSLCVIALCVMALTGCKSSKHGEDGHEEHLQFTAYNNDIEFYAEVSPLVVGEEAEFICHFTYLKDFKPVKEGEVKLTLSIGGKTVSATSKEAERPGIFRLRLKPEQKGKGKLTVTITNKQISSTVLLDGIEVFDDEEAAEEYIEAHEAKSANGVVFTKEMSWGIDFATAQAEMLDIGNVIRTVGQVQSSQGDEITIVAKASGIATFTAPSLTDGCSISSGQSICTIDASATVDNNLASQQAQALAELNRARKEYERLKALHEEKLVLESEFSSSKAAFETAEAAYNALKKGYGNGTQTVTATRGGFLKQLLINNGQYVNAGDAIAVITQSRTLQLKAEVPSRYYRDLSMVTGANIGKINGEISSNVRCRMLSYGRQASESSPLIPVVFEMDNINDYVAGSFVDMYITTRCGERKLCTRAEAVMEEMGNYFVFVQVTPELFEKRQVTIGVSDGVNIEIKSGIKADERIVTRGAVLVKLQQATGSVDPESGHHH